jgi:CubicO group peptidase (beta-lactamase class C family)
MRQKSRWIIVPSIAMLIVVFGWAGQATEQPPQDLASLETIAIGELGQTNTPGAAIAVVRGDQVVLARAFGVADVETGTAVRPDMLFRLGSTTKMLTATALNVLAEEGRVTLDAPIGTWIQGIDPTLGRVTAHQLLSHTAGVRDEAPMFGLHDDTALGARVRSMDAGFLFATPGDVFSYSNPGYWIAGHLAESVAGKPYADLMQEKVFAPLGMARTTLRPTLAMTWPLAQGHDAAASSGARVIRPAADNAATWPAGSIYSNVPDLARFVIAVLNAGRLDGKPVLPPAVVTRLTTGYVDLPGGSDGKYAYGLNVEDVRGVRMLRHGGSRSGYGSLIWMVPDQKVAVIVLANRTGASLSRTAMRALEMFATLAPPAPPVSPAPLAMTAAEMAGYVGTFSQTATPDAEILVKEQQLLLQIGTGAPQLMTKTGADRFAVTRPGASAPQTFFLTRGKDGTTLYLHQGTRALKRISGGKAGLGQRPAECGTSSQSYPGPVSSRSSSIGRPTVKW